MKDVERIHASIHFCYLFYDCNLFEQFRFSQRIQEVLHAFFIYMISAAHVMLHSGYIRHACIIVRVFSRCFPHRGSLFLTDFVGWRRATLRSKDRARRPYNIIKAQVKAVDRLRGKGRATRRMVGKRKRRFSFFLIRDTRIYFLRYDERHPRSALSLRDVV